MRRRAFLLLTMMALVLVLASGMAMAESQNGPIYYTSNLNILNSVDPASPDPQPTPISGYGQAFDTFDVSPDRKTLVYERGCANMCVSDPLGPLFTIQRLSPDHDFSLWAPTVVDITNLWACDRSSTDPDLNCSSQQMTMPRFSPDGKTIYFIGQRILASDDSTRGIYSVPTEGGEATRIPIENSDGTPQRIGTFALSHDGSTFAFSHKPADGNVGIFSVPVGGGVPTRVTDQGCRPLAASPSFSPDDRMIVFVSAIYSGDNCTGTAHQTVYTTPTNNDGTSPGTPLFPEDATVTSSLSKYSPVYSPDGKYIAFGNNLSNVWRLATAPATGGNVTVIDDAPCVGCDPLWLEQPLDTTITSMTMEPWEASTKTTFGFSSNDDGATFECKLDDGVFESCTSPKEYPGLAEGSSHTIEVRAIGPDGNADPTPARRTWTVDTTAPTVIGVSPTDGADSVALNTNVEITFSEDIAWDYRYFTLTKQGSASPVAWSSIGYSRLTHMAYLDPASDLEANTAYTATIKGGSTGANDLSGNALAQDRTWTFTTADTTPPGTTIGSGPSGNVRSTSASFYFSSSEAGSTFQCGRDGSAFSACTSPKSYSSLTQGSHTFRVRAIDKAGNVDATPASRSWFVDTVVPRGTVSINGGAASTASRTVTLRPSASDPSPASGVASMRFRNENSTTWSSWFAYSTSHSWTLSAGAGTKTVYVQFQDRAGNVSAAAYDKITFSP
jgi:Bacterial Ig-like domain/WD40-like Beta Propeller Repeat